jgi:hypothetical protein
VTALFAVPLSIYLWKKLPSWLLALMPSTYVLALIILSARGHRFFWVALEWCQGHFHSPCSKAPGHAEHPALAAGAALRP